jgi:carboxyl-terminal processing protease
VVDVARGSYGEQIANIRIIQLPQLHQKSHHARVSICVASLFIRSHYRQFTIDADFSSKILDRYLNMLDYSRNVLQACDVTQLTNGKIQAGEALKSGKLDIFYDLFNLVLKHRFERYNYALSLLEKLMNFTSTDTIGLDRSKEPWPKD